MDKNYDFFSIPKKFRVPKAGKVLLSEPFLLDDNFHRSVVFLTEINAKGALGYILNKPLKVSIKEIVNDFPDIDFRISVGGPVATNTLHFIHTLGSRIPDSVRVCEGIYWGGDYETLKNLISLGTVGRDEIRFFIGYAGWGQGQLAKEISENSWVVTHASREMIMSGSKPDIWRDLLKSIGGKYGYWPDFPENPGFN